MAVGDSTLKERPVWLLGPAPDADWADISRILQQARVTVHRTATTPPGEDAVVLLEAASDPPQTMVDMCARVTLAGPPRPLVVLTEKHDPHHIKALKGAGATDVLPRAWAETLLPDAVKRAGGRDLTAQVMEDALEATHAAVWTGTVLLDELGQPQQISVFYSPQFKALLGFAPHEFTDSLETWTERLHPSDEAPTLTALDAHIRLGEPYDVEFRLLRKDGTHGWFHARGQARREGTVVRLAGTLSDVSERRAQTAEALARQQRLANLMEQLPVGVVRVEGERLSVNAAVARLTGYPREELQTLSAWFDHLADQDAQAARRAYDEESRSGFGRPRLTTLNARGRGQRLVEFQAAGDAQEAFWLLRDLTEGEREAELYRTLGASIPNAGVALFDPQLRLLLVEGPELPLLSLDRHTVVGHLAREVLASQLADHVLPGMEAALRGETRTAQVAYRERVYEITTVPVRNARAEVMGGMVLALNVTERTRAVENLGASNERYRALLEGIPDLMLRINDEGLVVDVHVPAGRTPLLARGEMLNHHVQEALPGSSADVLWQLVKGALASGVVQTADITLGQPTNRTLEVRCVRSGPREATLICRDVTEVHQMQQRLMISERMATVGTLAAGVTHEINNPLAYVTGNLQFLEDDLQALMERLPQGLPQQALMGMLSDMLASVKDALHGTARVSQIVQDLRVFSRVEGETSSPVDLSRVLQTCVKMANNEIRQRAQLLLQLDAVPSVKGNEGRLGQVFLNLLINAAQSIPEGKPENHRITVKTLARLDGGVAVEIRDTGRGMTPEVMARVFEPFYTTKAIGEGTGLGLSICHGIVKSLGGEIEVESTPGQGSMFRVVLPGHVPGALPDRVLKNRITAAAPPPNSRILVIDDDPRVGLGLQRMLGTPYQVEIQLGAQGALSRLSEGHRYDLILCDLIMPQMSGMDFHEEVEKRFPDVRSHLAFMTGGAFTERAREFLRRVPNPRLEKPFGREDFAALLSAVTEAQPAH